MVMGHLEELIAAARGEIEVDLLLAGASVANVLSGEVHRADVAIHKGRIAGFDCSSARRTMELDGKILTPGFIDGHVHIESSMVTVPSTRGLSCPGAPPPWSPIRTRSPMCGARRALHTCYSPQEMSP